MPTSEAQAETAIQIQGCMAQTQVLSGASCITRMPRIDLNSTLLTAAAYLDGQAVLELEFRSSAVYRYVGVPAETGG